VTGRRGKAAARGRWMTEMTRRKRLRPHESQHRSTGPVAIVIATKV
jgi:hypothetical protein